MLFNKLRHINQANFSSYGINRSHVADKFSVNFDIVFDVFVKFQLKLNLQKKKEAHCCSDYLKYCIVFVVGL